MNKPIVIFLTHPSGYRVGMIARGIIQGCAEHNLTPVWRDYEDFDIASVRGGPVLGIIVWAGKESIRQIWLKEGRNYPVVSATGATLDLPIPTVAGDSNEIAEVIADHLVAEGLENFIFVGWSKNPAAHWRATAFEAAIARRLKRFDFRSFNVGPEERFWGTETGRGGELIALLREAPLPLAVVAVNDQTAVSCIRCIEMAGLTIPRQVVVAGVDDHPIYANMCLPLTTVRIDYSAIGRAAVDLLLLRQSFKHDGPRPVERRFVRGDLIIRESTRRRSVKDTRVMRALQHLHTHFAQRITLDELAKVAGMSRPNFSKRFHRTLGKPPIQYLIGYRIERAKLLLGTDDLTVSEVSHRVGFENHSYFGRAFREHVGMSPRDFRKSGARRTES